MTMLHKQSGYVLLLTLLVLAMAGVALAAVSTQSLQHTTLAMQQQRDLQRRWTFRSASETLLPMAETVLTQAEADAEKPAARSVIQLTLGGQATRLIVSDEQAKANLNTLLARRGERKLQRDLMNHLRRTHPNIIVQLKPLEFKDADAKDVKKPAPQDRAWPALGSFGQVFAEFESSELIAQETGAVSIGLADQITLWGDGALHFQRASASAMRLTTAPIMTHADVDQLIRLRDQSPGLGAAHAMHLIDAAPQQSQGVVRLMTNQSHCHSLWIIIDDGDRRWRQLTVSDQSKQNDDDTEPRDWLYRW